MRPRRFAAICLCTAGIALALPAGAETPQPAVEIPQIKAEEVTTGQIVSFVNAMIAVERVRRAYQPKLEAAETEEERAALAQEADAAAIAAVGEVVGIGPGEYLAIGRAAEENAELAQRIADRVAELRAKQQGTRAAPAGDQPAAE